MDTVFLLWHVRKSDGGADHEVLIGVYRTEIDAKAAIGRLRSKPGFAALPNGFQVYPYKLNEDHWTEGYVVAD
jgi:hypothetical protein